MATTFARIDALNRADTEQEVLDRFAELSALFGVEYFIITGLPLPGGRLEPLVIKSRWPPGWWERYMGRHYISSDPVGQHCYVTDMPFWWDKAPLRPGKEDIGRRILDEASEFGMPSGLSVPIHSEDGFQAAVSFAGSQLSLSDEDLRGMHLVALYAQGRLRQVRGDKLRRTGQLTDRERECASWAAVGKSTDDIADILGITRRTVIHHFENAQRKLNATNRVHLVAEAIRYRQISL